MMTPFEVTVLSVTGERFAEEGDYVFITGRRQQLLPFPVSHGEVLISAQRSSALIHVFIADKASIRAHK